MKLTKADVIRARDELLAEKERQKSDPAYVPGFVTIGIAQPNEFTNAMFPEFFPNRGGR